MPLGGGTGGLVYRVLLTELTAALRGDPECRGTGSTGCVLVGDACRVGCKSPELLLEKPAVLLTFHTGFLPCILLILVNLAPSG